jgi:hypothetical protein
MKIKERYVFLECTECKNRNYTTHKRQKAAYKLIPWVHQQILYQVVLPESV